MNNKSKPIIISIMSILLISVLFITSYVTNEVKGEEKTKNTTKKVKKVKTKKKEEKKKVLFVDVKGAVNNPGVYELEEGSRVNDAINISGGIIENADTSILNLSKKLEDEMIIIVYTKEEIIEYKQKLLEMNEINEAKNEENICPDSNNGACITNTSKKEKNENKNILEETEDELISINLGTKEDLMKVNGIGEGKANAIIKYREENGEFKQLEDIKNVSGIGDSIYEKIKDYIKL